MISYFNENYIFNLIYALTFFVFGFNILKIYNFKQAFFILVFRFLWTLPFLMMFYPKENITSVSNKIDLENINLFIDDSVSMGNAGKKLSQNIKKHINEKCIKYNCNAIINYLSDYTDIKGGFSNLKDSLSDWAINLNENWIIFTDAGDHIPIRKWPKSLEKLKNKKGIILGLDIQKKSNIWISSYKYSDYSFENNNLKLFLNIKRSGNLNEKQRPQLQALIEKKLIASTNIEFDKGMDNIDLELQLPPIKKGYHIIEIKIITSDQIVQDNIVYIPVEILENKLKLLHIAGSPSWDVHKLREKLKWEFKYDRISFFILRNINDKMHENTRELNLIPFPVNKLFNEELEKFRVIIMQNFNLSTFLDYKYQKNLVDFVKNGGGLLFIGGPNALTYADIKNSPLKEILPFEFNFESKKDQSFVKDLKFDIEFASPDQEKINLATVFDDLKNLDKEIINFNKAQGLNLLKNSYKNQNYTPLLNAKFNGRSLPFVIASYPEKGRAVWILTDSMWKFDLDDNKYTSQYQYHNFINYLISWIMKQDLKKTLNLNDIKFIIDKKLNLKWEIKALGSSTRYLNDKKNWEFSICGEKKNWQDINVKKIHNYMWNLQGYHKLNERKKYCNIRLIGKNKAFGEISANLTGFIGKSYKDNEIFHNINNLLQIQKITGADLKIIKSANDDIKYLLNDFFNKTFSDKPLVSSVNISSFDYYWFIDKFWYWILISFSIMEVFVRKYKDIYN